MNLCDICMQDYATCEYRLNGKDKRTISIEYGETLSGKDIVILCSAFMGMIKHTDGMVETRFDVGCKHEWQPYKWCIVVERNGTLITEFRYKELTHIICLKCLCIKNLTKNKA